MLKTIGLILLTAWALFFVIAALCWAANSLRERIAPDADPAVTDEELEKWRRAFEDTEFAWDKEPKR